MLVMNLIPNSFASFFSSIFTEISYHTMIFHSILVHDDLWTLIEILHFKCNELSQTEDVESYITIGLIPPPHGLKWRISCPETH